MLEDRSTVARSRVWLSRRGVYEYVYRDQHVLPLPFCYPAICPPLRPLSCCVVYVVILHAPG